MQERQKEKVRKELYGNDCRKSTICVTQKLTADFTWLFKSNVEFCPSAS